MSLKVNGPDPAYLTRWTLLAAQAAVLAHGPVTAVRGHSGRWTLRCHACRDDRMNYTRPESEEGALAAVSKHLDEAKEAIERRNDWLYLQTETRYANVPDQPKEH